jgi:hypothetical protein
MAGFEVIHLHSPGELNAFMLPTWAVQKTDANVVKSVDVLQGTISKFHSGTTPRNSLRLSSTSHKRNTVAFRLVSKHNFHR